MVWMFLVLSSVSRGADTGFPAYPSPDGRFVVRIDYNDERGLYYVIKDRTTGHTDASVGNITRLLWMKWGPDSRTFVTVEHIAHGSFARVVHYRAGDWSAHQVAVPSSGRQNSSVVGASIKAKLVHLRYKFVHEDQDGLNDGLGLCHFDVDVATGRTSRFVARRVSEQQFDGTTDIKKNF